MAVITTADNTFVRGERRCSVRSDYQALVTITIHDGPARGAAYVGLLRDISDGGIGVVLDNALLKRGTRVTVDIEGLPPIRARVCHCTTIGEGTLVGFSFAFANLPVDEMQWRAALEEIVVSAEAPERGKSS